MVLSSTFVMRNIWPIAARPFTCWFASLPASSSPYPSSFAICVMNSVAISIGMVSLLSSDFTLRSTSCARVCGSPVAAAGSFRNSDRLKLVSPLSFFQLSGATVITGSPFSRIGRLLNSTAIACCWYACGFCCRAASVSRAWLSLLYFWLNSCHAWPSMLPIFSDSLPVPRS